MKSKTELQILIDILAQVISAVMPSKIVDPIEKERGKDAHNLANRFFQHAITVLHLSGRNNINLPSFGDIPVTDPAAIDIITRASMEAFCVFHYIYYSPSTNDEGNFRYWTYQLIGLAERQNRPTHVFEHQKQKDEEKSRMQVILNNLAANPIFKNLTPKQQNGIEVGRQRDLWRWSNTTQKHLSWTEIMIDAGLSKMMAQHMYSHLSGHAHAGYVAAIQTQQAIVNQETEKLVTPALDAMKVLTANMIKEYTEIFKDARDKFDKTGAVEFVETWIAVGKRLDENN